MTAFGSSLILFLAGLCTAKSPCRSRMQATTSAALVFLFVCLSTAFLLSDYFTGEGINDAVVYHLAYGLEGAGFREYYPLFVAAAGLLLGGCVLAFVHYRRLVRDAVSRGKLPFVLSNALILSAILASPATSAVFYHANALGHYRSPDIRNTDFVEPELIVSSREGDFAVPDYTGPRAEADPTHPRSAAGAPGVRVSEDHLEFMDSYRSPVVGKGPGTPPNLVVIYAESLERTYFDENLFPGLLKGLRALEADSTYFTDIQQVVGSGWTMAGMVSGQCGLPLVTPSHGNSMSGMDSVYSGAICLGDLLRSEGYELSYLNGASLEFAGKGDFYTTHGFSDVRGRHELVPLLRDRSYVSPWGLYDDSLFDLAFEEFNRLSESRPSFGLFMLTLDTHHPEGHPSRRCDGIEYEDGSNAILNAVACSDHLISEFVSRVRRSVHGDNTVIVVISDHLAMRNTATGLLKKGDRSNLFMILDPRNGGRREITKRGTVLDMGPTVLHALGFEGEIGLGRDLLGDEVPLIARFGNLAERIHRWKPSIEGFWEFPRLEGDILVDAADGTVRIGVKEYQMPVLIELGANLETTPYFESPRKLHEYLLQFSEETAFLWFDKCYNARALEDELKAGPFCLVGGRLGGTLASTPLETNARIPVEALERALGGQTDRGLFGVRQGALLDFLAGEEALLRATRSERPREAHNPFDAHRIAHAGGEVDGTHYTNSIDALDANLGRGYRYFEIDLSFTKDGRLACIHDWEASFERSFGFESSGTPTLAEFGSLVRDHSEFEKCTLDSLADWMRRNPAARLVTDVKGGDNVEALRQVMATIPDAAARVIPQVYEPGNMSRVKDMGFSSAIWTLYRYGGDTDMVLRWTEFFEGSFAVTMPKHRADSGLAAELRRRRVPTYVHTINDREEMQGYLRVGVTEIYTDTLAPAGTATKRPRRIDGS